MKSRKFSGYFVLLICLISLLFFSPPASAQSQTERLQTAIAFFETGKTAEAKAIFDQLVAEGMVDDNLFYYLGSAILKLNQSPELALNYFNKISANSPLGYVGKGQYYIKKQNYSSAETQLNQALQKDPNCAEAYFHRGLLRGFQKKLDLAIADLEKCLKIKGNHAYAHYQLALAYNQKGRKDLMILHFQKFLYLAPEAPEAPQVKSLLSRLR